MLIGAASHLEHRHLPALLRESGSIKNQGLVLQRAAFRRPDVLPLYGSSELVKDVPDKASVFFRRQPTDFCVSPVGKPGTDTLIMLEKLAAIGPELRGKKVVLSLSPSWFFTSHGGWQSYDGNFSPLIARELAFTHGLSWPLRADLARRMLEFPASLEDRPLLRSALECLASGSMRDRWMYRALVPLGRFQNWLARLDDHIAVGFYIAVHLGDLKPPSTRELALNWDRLKARWSARAEDFHPRNERGQANAEQRFGERPDHFVFALDHSREWSDLELLLRTLQERGAHPLILSLPMNGVFFDSLGISAQARRHYYDRLRSLCSSYRVPELDFAEHELDPRFFADTYDHPSAKGWIYFDEAMDAFFHDRLQYAGKRPAPIGSAPPHD